MHIVIRDEFKNVRSAEIGNAVDTVIVGSHPDCHVYLPDIRIANEHLRICRDPEGGWQLELGDIPEDTPAAFTRIFVNALEVANGTIVHHNDEILMATFALRVFTDDSDVHAPLASAMEDAAKIRAHPLPAGAIIRNEAEIETAIPVSRVREMTTFAFEMHDCPDLAALLAATITALAKRFHARLVWMGARRHGYGRMEYVESRLVDGRAGGDPPRLETYLFRCCERGQYVCCPGDDHDDVESVLAIPLYGSRAILGMVYIDRGSGDAAFGAEHLDLLTTMGFAIGRQLELIMREQIKLHEAIAAGELSFMRELQSVMDPSNVPQWDGLQLAVYCKPGLDSAGDIYDVMRLPNGLASFFCGKVTGSPTTAALAMAEVRSAFRFAGLHADPPHVLLRALNWLLHDPRHPAALSAVGVVMNPKTGSDAVRDRRRDRRAGGGRPRAGAFATHHRHPTRRRRKRPGIHLVRGPPIGGREHYPVYPRVPDGHRYEGPAAGRGTFSRRGGRRVRSIGVGCPHGLAQRPGRILQRGSPTGRHHPGCTASGIAIC
jgi:hypothetical protein